MTEVVTLDTIQAKATALAAIRRRIALAAVALDDELAKLRKAHTPALRRIADQARTAEEELLDLVAKNAELFAKPRSREFEGVKVGWAKGKGRIEFDDETVVISRIRKHLADQEDTLVCIKESVDKKALGKLEARDLKKLGVSVIDAGDEAFVRFVDTAIDRLVSLLLGEEEAAS